MSDNVENLILEHLRHIRGKVDHIASDIDDLKARMSSLDASMVLVKREVNQGEDVNARQQVSLDRLAKRIDRIEARLELS